MTGPSGQQNREGSPKGTHEPANPPHTQLPQLRATAPNPNVTFRYKSEREIFMLGHLPNVKNRNKKK